MPCLRRRMILLVATLTGILGSALFLVSMWLADDMGNGSEGFGRKHAAKYQADSSISWQAASPVSQNMDGAKLDALRRSLASRGTWAFLVVRQDKIVYEWYREDGGENKLHYTASLQKSLAAGMALLVAMNDGRLSLDDRASRYIPAFEGDPLRSQISIRHLATHSSGIENAAEIGIPKNELKGWKREFWRRVQNPFSLVLENAQVRGKPGTTAIYSNPGFALLGYAITASLRGAPEQDIRTLLRKRVMEPIGVPEGAWKMGYQSEYQLDGLKLVPVWGGGSYTARAVARVGQLMLNGGRWNGRQLVKPQLAEYVVTYQGTPLPDRSEDASYPAATAGWRTNFDGVWPTVPRDAFAGAGAGHQILLVVPSLDLVVVRLGEFLGNKGEPFWMALHRHLLIPLMASLIEPPYPKSPLIEKVSFDPVASITRRAIGSDNWPITWADDDLLYTAYGDGWGFEPGTRDKLSLGFARISGGARDFRGENVRSASGERIGDGQRGPKASGMLGIEGVLYMWVRNVANSQLAWSADHGRTWKWGFRFSTSFGSPAFLNFGRDYDGARDDFVYTYSQDGPSAYVPDDGIVLARVARSKISERLSYEFFAGLDESGRPLWNSRIEVREPVFRFPGRCARVDVVYDPAIRRYLMALAFDRKGGWGLFDAPEPWGPWTTAFFTAAWDLGDTHGYRLPSKWISNDGREMYVVVSGVNHAGEHYDAFSVRRMTLHPKRKADETRATAGSSWGQVR
jgi:CubicO group peptidase (beta-lactamase class C family)